MILPILAYPNDILEKKAKKVENANDPEIKELVLDMLETLVSNNGMGLAAPQIGKSLRICVVKAERKTYILINPEIKSKSLRKEIMEEGCLSFPGKFIPIKRSRKVTVEALDRRGEKIKLKAEGILSRAFQHEIDHLDGVLLSDRAEKKYKKVLL